MPQKPRFPYICLHIPYIESAAKKAAHYIDVAIIGIITMICVFRGAEAAGLSRDWWYTLQVFL